MTDRKASRRCIFSITVVLLFIFSLVCNSFFTAYAQEGETTTSNENEEVVTGTTMVQEYLSLRTIPSRKGERIAKIANNEIVQILAEEGEFYKIRYQDKEGYVLKKYILLPEELTGKHFLCEAVIPNASSPEDRNYNMAKACEKLNGYVLQPGAQFEWYQTVGVANRANGYRKATVISGGKYVQGYGGGVCQVSTALYNAVLKQGLQVDRVYHHSLPSSYVAEGYDATVSYSSDERYLKTLEFTNNTSFPIEFQAFEEGGTVTVRFYALNQQEEVQAGT